MEKYTYKNAKTIDQWVKNGWEWGKPLSHEEYLKALKGDFKILLTPVKAMPKEWLGEIKGKKVLGLASGGGQQMPILTALGAQCTVMDLSDTQLESEKMVAEREGYKIKIVKADMTERFPLADEEFDLIINPVANCYVEEIQPIWHECARVLKKGGVLLTGFENAVGVAFNEKGDKICCSLPFNPLKNEEQRQECLKENCGYQFSHTLREEIIGQIEEGFRLEDLYEDVAGKDDLLSINGIPCFIATKSIKD
ncbi:MAG: class I SAM-dependent methyltransferase [Bacilli bacterium]|jgi:ubiquinone/menaquinone biosynthesis C-methylase UbiE|nr:class I SAM-dependent methyltransferase [Bacilli bacterium]